MIGNVDTIAVMIAALCLTYIFHSTLAICAIWLLHRTVSIASYALSERLWKLGAAFALLTAPIQLAFAPSTGTWLIPLVPASPAPRQPTAVTASQAAVNAPRATNTLEETRFQGGTEPHRRAPATAENIGQLATVPTNVDLEPEGAQSPIDAAQVRSSATTLALDPILWDDASRLEPAPTTRQINDQTKPATMPRSIAATRSPYGVPAGSSASRRSRQPAASSTSHSAFLWIVFAGLGFAFSIGMLAGLALIMLQSASLRKRFRTAQKLLDGPARRALDRLCHHSGTHRTVRLIASKECDEPLSFGWLRWTIALPVGLEQQLTKQELRALLAHELAHLARGDTFWLWLGRVLCTCFTFQPLNHLARRRWQAASEFCCDDWAVRQGLTPLALARCLTHVSQWRLDGPAANAALGATGGHANAVVERVSRLVEAGSFADRWAVPSRQRLLLIVAALSAIALLRCTPAIAISWDRESRQNHSAHVSKPPAPDKHNASLKPDEWADLNEQLRQLESDMLRVQDLLNALPANAPERETAQPLDQLLRQLQQRYFEITRQLQDGRTSVPQPTRN